MSLSVPILVSLAVLALFIFMNERFRILRQDHFPTIGHRWAAYAWLGVLITSLTILVSGASGAETAPRELENMPFWSLFLSHVILAVFLLGWWSLSGRPALRTFFNLPHSDGWTASLTGIAVGVGGWALTLGLAVSIAALLMALDLMPKDVKPSPMIPWMASLPLWQKGIIVLTAMSVEELFFRGWLQKRVGLVISTIIFALAHAGYGQPLMLIGVTIVSLVIGYTFYRTRNLWPCIVAHGVFDAIQLFVIVPLVVQTTGMA